jgi:hypothetical protein
MQALSPGTDLSVFVLPYHELRPFSDGAAPPSADI